MFVNFLEEKEELVQENRPLSILQLVYFTGQNVCLFAFLEDKEELVQENILQNSVLEHLTFYI